MRRREVVRGLGLLAGGLGIGGAVSGAAFARQETAVRQVVEGGRPQPRTVLTLELPDLGRVDAADAARIHVWTPIVDPGSSAAARMVDVLDASAGSSTLRLEVDGPVSQGAVVSFAPGALVVDGRAAGAFSHAVEGDLPPPERATQWFKAYVPTDVDRFAPALYPDASRPAGATVDDGPAATRERLAAHLDRFVARDRLSPAARAATLARFDDPAVRARFVGADGGFDPEALAGVLATAGTVARGADAVLIDGANQFGRPYAVRRQPTVSGGLMEVRVEAGAPTVSVDPRLDGEPFGILAPLFAHEALHQDLAVGLQEEVIATYLETLVWAEQLLADPALARLDTPRTRRANTMLLVALNSGGRSFPDVGLTTAPHRQSTANAAPGAAVPVPDFRTAVESNYRRTLPGSTPAPEYARRVVGRVTGAAAVPSTLGFDAGTLATLDERTRLLSPADVGRLLAALSLRPASSTGHDSVPADPVAAADARGGDLSRVDDPAVADAHVGSTPETPHWVGTCGTCRLAAGGD